jgi:hypothetical protein
VKVLEDRKVPPPPSDFTHWRSILPGITQGNSQCLFFQRPFGVSVLKPLQVTAVAKPMVSYSSTVIVRSSVHTVFTRSRNFSLKKLQRLKVPQELVILPTLTHLHLPGTTFTSF